MPPRNRHGGGQAARLAQPAPRAPVGNGGAARRAPLPQRPDAAAQAPPAPLPQAGQPLHLARNADVKIRADAIQWKDGNPNEKPPAESKIMSKRMVFKTETGLVKTENDNLDKLYGKLKDYKDKYAGAKRRGDTEVCKKIIAEYSSTLKEIDDIRTMIKVEGMPLPFPKGCEKLPK